MDERERSLRERREKVLLKAYLALEGRLERMGALKEVEAMAICHGATLEEVYGPSRMPHIVRARYEVWRFVRIRYKWSYPAIGMYFNRDHTTVMAGVRKAEQHVESNEGGQEDAVQRTGGGGGGEVEGDPGVRR